MPYDGHDDMVPLRSVTTVAVKWPIKCNTMGINRRLHWRRSHVCDESWRCIITPNPEGSISLVKIGPRCKHVRLTSCMSYFTD